MDDIDDDMQGLAHVPIYIEGGLAYVVIDEIPQPFRGEFCQSMTFGDHPAISGQRCAYLRDWLTWLQDRGSLRG